MKVWRKWTEISIILRIIVGLILGLIIGLVFPSLSGIAILGDVFVGALKAIAPLLVFFLVVGSLCKGTQSHTGIIKMVIILYMFSTLVAALLAVFASMLFKVEIVFPSDVTAETIAAPSGIVEVLKTLLMNVVQNPVTALSSANYIGILSWAVFLGLALKSASDSTKNVFSEIGEGLSKVVAGIITLAPFGIMGLVYSSVVSTGLGTFVTYGKLLVLLVGCMLTIYFVTNPILVYWCIRKNPYPLILKC